MNDRRIDQRALGFPQRVMVQVTREPTPTPARVFLRSIAGLRMADSLATLRTAWHLAFDRAVRVPVFLRVQSLAVLLIAALVTTGGGALAQGPTAEINTRVGGP